MNGAKPRSLIILRQTKRISSIKIDKDISKFKKYPWYINRI